MAARPYDNALRRQQADLTRRRILDTVRDLLMESRTSFSIPEIAARAGVSEPTIYRHFPNRDALLEALAAGKRQKKPRLVDEEAPERGGMWAPAAPPRRRRKR